MHEETSDVFQLDVADRLGPGLAVDSTPNRFAKARVKSQVL